MEPIPLFPLGNALFPGGLLRLRIFEVRYLDLVRRCVADNKEFGVVVLLSGREVRTPLGTEQLATTGTMARIDRYDAAVPGLVHIQCTGTTRFHLLSHEQLPHGLWMGEAVSIADDSAAAIPTEFAPSANALGKLIASLQQNGVNQNEMPIAPPFRLDESGWVADRWSELLSMPPDQKAALLALTDPVQRLGQVHRCLTERGLLD